jgi:hypothetical protein
MERMILWQRRLMGDMGAEYTATDYFKPHDQLETMLAGLDVNP